jgi:cellulose synthase (UDP-forming)
MMLGLVVVTALGLLVNASYNHQIVGNGALVPVVAFWSIVNMVVLTVVATIAITPPRLRAEERFPLDELCELLVLDGGELIKADARLSDLSLSGAFLRLDAPIGPRISRDSWVVLDIQGVGRIAGLVRRVVDVPGGLSLGLQFDLPVSRERDALVEKLFTSGIDNSTHAQDAWAITWAMIGRIFRSDAALAPTSRTGVIAPAEIAAICHDRSDLERLHLDAWEADLVLETAPDDRPRASAA